MEIGKATNKKVYYENHIDDNIILIDTSRIFVLDIDDKK